MRSVLLIFLAMQCSMAYCQDGPTKAKKTVKASKKNSPQGDAEYNIDLKLPSRLVKLSSNETTIVFRDRKSKATLEINRNRFSEFSGQSSAEAELLYIDKLGDPNCFEVSQGTLSINVGACEIVSWKTKVPSRTNDQNSMAMLEVGGTTYDFHISHSSRNEKEINSLFERILKSIKRSNS